MMNNTNKNEIILPVTFPAVSSFPAETYVLLILLNYSQTEDWIYNNFVNLYGYITNENFIYQAFTLDEIRKVCPFISLSELRNREFIEDNFNGIIQFIKKCIASGYYVTIQYDQYFLRHTLNYNRVHRMHELFIYGFNDEAEKFYVSDFFYNSKLSSQEVSFSELEESVKHVPSEIFGIDLLKFIDVNYEFNYDIFIKDLNDYLNSTRTVLCYEENCLTPPEIHRLSEGGYVFGISNYDLINKAFSQVIDRGHDNGFGDIYYRILRSAHALYNHKVLMLERLKFLQKKGMQVNADSILNYERIVELCQTNRNLSIKYRVTRDASIVQKIINNYEIVKIEEERILRDLVNILDLSINNAQRVGCAKLV